MLVDPSSPRTLMLHSPMIYIYNIKVIINVYDLTNFNNSFVIGRYKREIDINIRMSFLDVSWL